MPFGEVMLPSLQALNRGYDSTLIEDALKVGNLRLAIAFPSPIVIRESPMTTAKKPAQRFVIFLSLFAFTGSIGYSAIQMISSIQNTQQASAAVSENVPSQAAQLKSLENSYQLVLQREPENETALKGLVEVRLQMGANQEAVPVLETLVKLNPNHAGYQALLKKTKQTSKTTP